MTDDARAAKGTGATPHPAVRRATGSRYAKGGGVGGLGARASERGDGPVRPGTRDPAHDPARAATWSDGRRSRVYTTVTALPVLMLVGGLALFYRAESVQSGGAPIRAEATVASGVHRGLSVVRTGGRGQHFLWFDDEARGRRGVRVSAAQERLLRPLLEIGDPIVLDVAPTVEGSAVPWVWRVRRGEEVLLDDSARLR